MAELAIRGHATRGKEVIELLEMLGGKNAASLEGFKTACWYFLDKNNFIGACTEFVEDNYITFTLEDFLANFPYKVGDKVMIRERLAMIESMMWHENRNCVRYLTRIDAGASEWCHVDEIRSYVEQLKEKDMKEEIKQAEIVERIVLPFGKERMEIVVADDCELVNEDGKMFVVRKQPKYPKTYEGCCKVLGISTSNGLLHDDSRVIIAYKIKLIAHLQELLICRDAYWKLAGDWRPTFDGSDNPVWVIDVWGDSIMRNFYHALSKNMRFAFPTEEMRDAFYENFKDLIEECKELL